MEVKEIYKHDLEIILKLKAWDMLISRSGRAYVVMQNEPDYDWCMYDKIWEDKKLLELWEPCARVMFISDIQWNCSTILKANDILLIARDYKTFKIEDL